MNVLLGIKQMSSDTNKSVVHVSNGSGVFTTISLIIATIAILKGESLERSNEIMQVIYTAALIYSTFCMFFIMLLPAFLLGCIVALPGIVSEKEETLVVMIVLGFIFGIVSYIMLMVWWFGLLPFEYLL